MLPTQKISGFSDLRDVWRIVARRKWLIFIPFIVVAGLTYAASYLLTPEFESSTIVAISPQIRLSGELQRMLGTPEGGRRADDTRNELRSIHNEITSSRYVALLAERLQLDQNPEIRAKARKIRSQHPEIPEQQAVLDLLQESLRDKVTVNMAAQDHVLITVLSPDPQRAKDISTTLGEIFVSEKLKGEVTSLRSSQNFSDVQLEKYEALLQSKINEKTAFEKRLLDVQLDAAIISEANRLDIQSEIDQTNTDIADLQKQEREAIASIGRLSNGRLSGSTVTLREGSDISDIRGELQSQLQNISSYMTKYPWSDPQVLNLKLKQNSLLNSLEAAQRRQVNEQYSDFDAATRDKMAELFGIRANLDFLYSKALYLGSSLDQLTDKTKLGPEYQATLNRLNQEIVAATELRNNFKRQQESSSISQALLQEVSSSKYRVVEPGKLPLAPVKPDRIKILLMGLALGLMIGGATAIVMELLDTSFKKVEEVEAHLGLPVIGVAPRIDFMSRVSK